MPGVACPKTRKKDSGHESDRVNSAGSANCRALAPEDWPDVSQVVTEDDTPVDNMASLRQQTLLIDSLYTSYVPPDGQPFIAAANVGIFHAVKQPPIVPDFFLSLDSSVPEPYWAKHHRSFFTWVYGKFPELVLEIVSNKEGGEDDSKVREYLNRRILYYVIFDPAGYLSKEPLRVFSEKHKKYEQMDSQWLPDLELGLTLQQGVFEGMSTTWLRWCDASGNILLTGAERAAQEKQRADNAATQIDRLRAQLKALGIEPTE